MTIKEAMAAYFGRFPKDTPFFKTCDTDDVDPRLFSGEPDEDGYVRWVPAAKVDPTDLSELERRAGSVIHPSIKDYFNTFWFMAMGGRFADARVTLDPVVPGRDLADLEQRLFGADYGPYKVSGYLATHGGVLRHIPIGLHHPDDLLLVVDNATGEVLVEDHERGTFTPLAPGLAELIAGLRIGK